MYNPASQARSRRIAVGADPCVRPDYYCRGGSDSGEGGGTGP
jgi:hypothetical protein